jgi:hypothetical protein
MCTYASSIFVDIYKMYPVIVVICVAKSGYVTHSEGHEEETTRLYSKSGW